jgi:predicted permease
LSALRDGRLTSDDRGHSRATRAQRVLIAGQTTLAMLLLALAGLVVHTVTRLAAEDLGVRPAGVLLFDVSVAGRYVEPPAAQAFVQALLDRLRGAPRAIDAAAASRRPLFGGGNGGFAMAGREASIEGLEVREVTPGYFAALGVPHLSGRRLGDGDRLTGGVVLVNRAFERVHLGGASALGGSLQPLSGRDGFVIVGVVGDVREFGPTQPARPTAYFPYGRGPYGLPVGLTIVVRAGTDDPLAIVPYARAALRDLDPHIAMEAAGTLAAEARSRIGRDRLTVQALLSVAAGLAVLLTAVGVFGVMGQSVARRTREIGIRRALGATRAGVMTLLLRQGLALALPGLVLGAGAFLWGGRLVESYLYGVPPTDAKTLATAAAVLVVALVMACWLPARRAARVEAIEALRASGL